MQRGYPLRVCAYVCNAFKRPDSLSIPASCRQPSMGPNRFAINPLGMTNELNFKECTHLRPLYTSRCSSSGWDIGRTVPSIRQLAKMYSSSVLF